ncbi:MAG: DUF72 domain-containing protein [Pseudomonadota bacterium]
MAEGRIRVGISGWRYAGWRGVFYPKGLTQARELEFASRRVQSIEINGSHYSLQSAESYGNWHDATPPGFMFSVKGPRFLTHMLRLDPLRLRAGTANFLASGLFCLRAKLGPILWQFPPNFVFEPERFEAFLQMLPQDTHAAAALAREHDRHVRHPALEPGRKRRMRHAVEVRHDTFCTPAFIAMLRKYRVAFVVSDSVMPWPYAEGLCTDFIYLRLHGTQTLYGGEYSDDALDRWASRLQSWAAGRQPSDARLVSSILARKRGGRDVFCYFDNDQKVQAPQDAQRLMTRLAAQTVPS